MSSETLIIASIVLLFLATDYAWETRNDCGRNGGSFAKPN